MKLICIVAFLFLLSACGRNASPTYACDLPLVVSSTPIPTHTPSQSALIPTPTPTPFLDPLPIERTISYEPEYIPIIPRWIEGEALLVEHFLCDFDYLMHTLRHNFPLFGPAYRRHGLNIESIEALTRQAIITSNPTDPHSFSMILAQNFFNHFGGFGHLYQHWEARLHLVLANIYRDSIDENGDFIHMYSQRIYEVMRAPAATRFYGNISVDIGQYEHNRINPNNLSTKIIEEDKIAYVNVRLFNHYNIDHDRDIMMAFYDEIRDFDHLIIDLQQNPGGFTNYFYELFVMPNLVSPLKGRMLEFFPASRNNLVYADALIGDMLVSDPFSVTVHYNAADFARENNMPYFNEDDLAMLHNVIEWHIKIDPINYTRAFNGKIWVLIGPMSESGVEAVAIFVKETGFATLVGQPTAGIMGAISAYKLLPNSGILVRYDLGYMTDSYGRSFEEFGVHPHYFSPIGGCALETVLALIEAAQ